ncbi:hypothetical protein [Pseudomonas sp. Teo4]|uniref:hypothetical protein n=1 Tax=Pseudomonas sp. Teo4 TaxID=3064528 RepID=UPI002ACB1153|nr:hypothetical protein [Pseudomonas sp. Teo4]
MIFAIPGIDGQQVLNGLVQYAIQKERQSVSEDLNVIVSNRIKEIDNELASARAEYDIGKMSQIAALQEGDDIKRAQLNDELRALRAQLKLRRADRIAQLDEAIAIARSLGLKRPSTPSSMGHSEPEGAGRDTYGDKQSASTDVLPWHRCAGGGTAGVAGEKPMILSSRESLRSARS